MAAKVRMKFRYWDFGLWRGTDSLGRYSKFYSWEDICRKAGKK